MKNKKIITKVARIFRAELKTDFVHSINLAKVFLKGQEWEATVKNDNMGFEYDWAYDSESHETLVFAGWIHWRGNWYEITNTLYNLRADYEKNQRRLL